MTFEILPENELADLVETITLRPSLLPPGIAMLAHCHNLDKDNRKWYGTCLSALWYSDCEFRRIIWEMQRKMSVPNPKPFDPENLTYQTREEIVDKIIAAMESIEEDDVIPPFP